MPHDPHAGFDQDVLGLIEHSPVGAVPGTPAYQDALKRLQASHQVYPDADHKDGYVTARTLATRPCFHASNLDALIAGTIDANDLEPNAKIFDRYVAALPVLLRPKAEALRAIVAGRAVHHRVHGGVIAHDPVHTVFLVPGAGPNPGIPGNYLHGSVLQGASGSEATAWAVHLHDRDDGAAIFETATMAGAMAKLQEVIASVPFHLSELEALGFRLN
ncbi:MAG: hypothetical protein Q7S40_30530 [Opitutaceae bacterium]|nr:hypothetical protein [Opitutaceae bacterium]